MNYKLLSGRMALLICLSLGIGGVAHSQAKTETVSAKDVKDQAQQSEKAAQVFKEIMDTPDKGIPTELLETARCVAVFPNVLKAGFIVGGRGGRGVASCSNAGSWSSPAFFNLGGGSIGLQIGAQSTDFVLLFMNDKGMNSLLSDQFELGGDAAVAAGPVGRQAGASTDLKLTSEILSYSRSKGLFAGLELKGVVIKPDKDDMREVYGGNITAREVLNGNKAATAASVSAFPTTLSHYAAGRATKETKESTKPKEAK